MESHNWDSLVQFISDGLVQSVPTALEKPAGVADHATHLVSSQVPTPPDSGAGSSDEDVGGQRTSISMSTMFHPGANLVPAPTDLIVLSSDSVFFYVHFRKLFDASENGFGSLLTPPSKKGGCEPEPILSLPEHSAIINVMLHAIYNISASNYSPSIDTIVSVVESMSTYGVSLQTYVAPSTPMFSLLLEAAISFPIEIYLLASSMDLEELAVATSTRLLPLPLESLTDNMVMKMGPIYLKRLFFLHLGRIEALKRLLLPPPQPHPPTIKCDFINQMRLARAWALASASLAWEGRPDLATSDIEAALCPLADHLSCDQCKLLLRDRISNLMIQWSAVKNTIQLSPLPS